MESGRYFLKRIDPGESEKGEGEKKGKEVVFNIPNWRWREFTFSVLVKPEKNSVNQQKYFTTYWRNQQQGGGGLKPLIFFAKIYS